MRADRREEESVFVQAFDWTTPMRTSLHRHAGWELVLVHRGEVSAVIDGQTLIAGQREFIELPTGSVHAIWAESASFDVIGQAGLGLWMVIPDEEGRRSEIPIYGREGPWRLDPPAGVPYTSPEEVDRIRELSQKLL